MRRYKINISRWVGFNQILPPILWRTQKVSDAFLHPPTLFCITGWCPSVSVRQSRLPCALRSQKTAKIRPLSGAGLAFHISRRTCWPPRKSGSLAFDEGVDVTERATWTHRVDVATDRLWQSVDGHRQRTLSLLNQQSVVSWPGLATCHATWLHHADSWPRDHITKAHYVITLRGCIMSPGQMIFLKPCFKEHLDNKMTRFLKIDIANGMLSML